MDTKKEADARILQTGYTGEKSEDLDRQILDFAKRLKFVEISRFYNVTHKWRQFKFRFLGKTEKVWK